MVFFTSITGARKRGFGGLGALALAMDKATYRVGESPSYTISGGAPNADILWSSTRDGVNTGENASGYGQKTDAQGVWSGSGGGFTSGNLGWWTKTAIVGNENATKSFQVLPAASATTGSGNVYVGVPVTQQHTQAGFFDGNVTIMGQSIPKWAAYGGGALLAYFLLFKKK